MPPTSVPRWVRTSPARVARVKGPVSSRATASAVSRSFTITASARRWINQGWVPSADLSRSSAIPSTRPCNSLGRSASRAARSSRNVWPQVPAPVGMGPTRVARPWPARKRCASASCASAQVWTRTPCRWVPRIASRAFSCRGAVSSTSARGPRIPRTRRSRPAWRSSLLPSEKSANSSRSSRREPSRPRWRSTSAARPAISASRWRRASRARAASTWAASRSASARCCRSVVSWRRVSSAVDEASAPSRWLAASACWSRSRSDCAVICRFRSRSVANSFRLRDNWPDWWAA